ncbi:MAG: O-antigen ligase family protein [Candidatus Caldatribacterium sp.]|nr:O-antigen ligase family protein [Candidatus Caldatribacterium sp.]
MASWPRGKFLLGVTLLLVAVGIIFLLAVHSGIVGGGATRLLDVSLCSRNVWERLIFYRDGLKIFFKRPLAGWGGGGWKALYLSIRSFPYATRATHNLYLQLLIEGGVVGAALFLLFSLIRETAGALGSDRTPWTTVLFGGLLLSFLHGFVDFNFSLGAYQLGVWFLAGCAASFFLGKHCSPEANRSVRLHPLAIGLVSLFLFTLASSSVVAEWWYTFGRYFVEEDELDEAIRVLEKATRLEPWNPEIYYYLSKTLRKKANLERSKAIHTKAVEAGERAIRLAPYNSLFLEHLGILYAERGEFHRALSFMERAIAADPLRISPYLNLAKMCRIAGIHSLEKGEKEEALFFLERGIRVRELLEKARERSLEPPQWDPAEVQEVETLVEELGKLKAGLPQSQE